MDETTIKTLTDMREGLLSLARAHRNVIPPTEVTATQLTEWAVALREILNVGPESAERAPGAKPDGWQITVTYSDGHAITDTASALYTVSEVLAKHAGSEHGDMERVLMV